MSPSEGVIPPEDEVVITTTYSPVSTGTFSRDHYEIVTTGGNKVSPGSLCSFQVRYFGAGGSTAALCWWKGFSTETESTTLGAGAVPA